MATKRMLRTEAKCRTWRTVVVVQCAVIAFVLLSGQSKTAKELVAEKFVLVDGAGKRMGELALVAGVPRLSLFGPEKSTFALLEGGKWPSLLLRAHPVECSVGLHNGGLPSMSWSGEKGKPWLVLSMDQNHPYMIFFDRAKNRPIHMWPER
jgi:hypothetical protein